MKLLLDGVEQTFDGDSPEQLIEVIAAVSNHLDSQQRAIINIVADGESVLPSEIRDLLSDKTVADLNELSITSELLSVLVGASLNDLREVLPELPKACHTLAEVFQGDVPEEGFDLFRQLAEIWENIKVREQQLANALGIDLNTLQTPLGGFLQMHEDLNSYLREAAEATKEMDTVLLGDLLEYELAPRAEAETAIVDQLQAQARKVFGEA
jgi:hypothetical protein